MPGLLGSAPAVRALRRSIHLIGTTRATVLLLGESGTGKEVVARFIHRGSPRSHTLIELQPLSAINNVLERHEHGGVPSPVVLDLAHG